MKILLILFTLFSLSFSAQIDEFAREVSYERNYDKALKMAKEQNKVLMFVLVGDYCPWCKKFERKTLKSDEVRAEVKKNFIALVMDKYKEKEKYPKIFYGALIPVVYFIDPHTQKSIMETVAYMKKEEFLENAEDANGLFSKESKK
ncbi:thioredoxin family protein [Sulfurimonas sp. MAG313]|nr:thioredoxin family protein [Sulfurimonas sp. MAG313]MDF1881689.1 thioredoxin family protein [Sulfurimonas sp. MAG313]